MATRERLWMALGAIVILVLLVIGFRAYLHPDMVIEFANLLLCS